MDATLSDGTSYGRQRSGRRAEVAGAMDRRTRAAIRRRRPVT